MKDRLTNNVGLKVMSVLFAILLWALVVNIDDPIDEETYRSVPVKVLHEEIFTSKASTYRIIDGYDTVNVIVRAKRSVLSQIKASDIEVTADIKDRVSNSLSEATLPMEVVIRGFEGDYVEAYTAPRNLEIEIEPSTQKDFVISVTTIGTPRDGNVLGKLKANPESIRLGGGESQINRVKRVVAQADVSGISSSGMVEARLYLFDSNDKEIEQELFENNLGSEGLKVEVEVLKKKDVPLELETDGIKPAAGHALGDISYEPRTIAVAGGEEDIKSLTKVTIPSEAFELDGISSTQEVSIDVSEYLPENISLVDATAGTVIVTVAVEKFGTKVFNIPSNNIIFENALISLKPSVAKMENIEIQVTGSAEALAKLTEVPRVFVDLEKYTTAGTATVTIQADLPPGCTLVKNVTVQIVLTQQEQ